VASETREAGEFTMQAMVREIYGTADVLRTAEVERPAPTDGEVLVRVRAAGLDRGAWHMLTGEPYLMRLAGFGLRRPKNPGLGSDVAGVVEAVGAGVAGLAVGDEVFGMGRNTFAEYAVARADMIAAKPAALSFEQAAAVPVSAVTALQALRDQGQVRAGQSVLVIGASGGVGTFAVQLAKALGAEVTGVCSTAKLDLVRSLGADHVVDYTTTRLEQTGARYDLVLDIGGNRPLRALRRLLTPRGTLVFVGGEDGGGFSGGLGRQLRSTALSPFVGQRLGGMWIAKVNTADLEALTAMIDVGAVVPALDRVCALSQLPQAMGDLAAGRVRGKIAVAV
jgi:NADPH:quinone reductase-like Zn-dependent oxidoreductase